MAFRNRFFQETRYLVRYKAPAGHFHTSFARCVKLSKAMETAESAINDPGATLGVEIVDKQTGRVVETYNKEAVA